MGIHALQQVLVQFEKMQLLNMNEPLIAEYDIMIQLCIHMQTMTIKYSLYSIAKQFNIVFVFYCVNLDPSCQSTNTKYIDQKVSTYSTWFSLEKNIGVFISGKMTENKAITYRWVSARKT